MQSRYFSFWTVTLFFLSIVSGLTFVNTEAAAMYCGEPNGKLNYQHSKMLIEKIGKKLEEKRSELIELYVISIRSVQGDEGLIVTTLSSPSTRRPYL